VIGRLGWGNGLGESEWVITVRSDAETASTAPSAFPSRGPHQRAPVGGFSVPTGVTAAALPDASDMKIARVDDLVEAVGNEPCCRDLATTTFRPYAIVPTAGAKAVLTHPRGEEDTSTAAEVRSVPHEAASTRTGLWASPHAGPNRDSCGRALAARESHAQQLAPCLGEIWLWLRRPATIWIWSSLGRWRNSPRRVDGSRRISGAQPAHPHDIRLYMR
jgi:hypothetical protein